MPNVSYERFVQWVSGPVSGAIGLGFTELVSHVGVLSEITKGHEANISRSIVQGVTFGVTTLVTYAAHHKWLDNLNKWWEHETPAIEGAVAKIDPAASKEVDQYVSDADVILNEIISGQKAAIQIQEHPELVRVPAQTSGSDAPAPTSDSGIV